MTTPLVVLTGASGSGKTALAHQLESHGDYEVLFFDSIGVPSSERMCTDHGSGEEWQRAMTYAWVKRIKPLLAAGRPVLFEGQMRIAFIREALACSKIESFCILLVDCDDATRTSRLHSDRAQPELANPDMMNWARFLRDEAMELGIEILDTSSASLAECTAVIAARLNSGS